MGLAYYYTLAAPAIVHASILENFLKCVEDEAKALGFEPTMVLNAEFDTLERREFARRTIRALHLEDERLKGVVLPDERQVCNFSPVTGFCRVLPERAVLLVLTEEHGAETVMGFAWYPAAVQDRHGSDLVRVPEGGKWFWRDFVQSPDPRYRKLVKRFEDMGYLEAERDEFSR